MGIGLIAVAGVLLLGAGVTILAGWIKHRYELHYLLANLVTYAWFPLITGIVFHEAAQAMCQSGLGL